MPNITGVVTQNDSVKATYYTDTATTTLQTFSFTEQQDAMTFTSKGSSILTLTVAGKSYKIPPYASISVDDDKFNSFDIVSTSTSQPFELNSIVKLNPIYVLSAQVANNSSQISDLSGQIGLSGENKYNYVYNANGDIQTVTEKSKTDVLISTTTYTYKTDGNVDTSVKVSGSTTLTTTYIYDANGNLTDTVSVKS